MAKKGNFWLEKQKQDKFYKKSKFEGHRARSYYKIKHMDEKFNLFLINGRHPKKILDLGAAPGAWLEYIAELYKNRPIDQQSTKFRAIGIDLTSIKPFSDAPFIETYRFNVFDEKCEKFISENAPFDVILSDLAPKTTGDYRDVAIQTSMVEKVLYFSKNYMRNHGNVAIKMFQSEETDKIINDYKNMFRMFKRSKPQSSRETSRELYLIGLDFIKMEN